MRTMASIALGLFLLVNKASAPSNTSGVDLAWDYDFSANPTVTNVIIGYGTMPGTYGFFKQVGTVHADTVSGLVKNIRYYFSVAPLAGGVQGEWSDEVNVVTPRK